jgi:membrane protein involved in colicin uptake
LAALNRISEEPEQEVDTPRNRKRGRSNDGIEIMKSFESSSKLKHETREKMLKLEEKRYETERAFQNRQQDHQEQAQRDSVDLQKKQLDVERMKAETEKLKAETAAAAAAAQTALMN